MKQRRPKIGFVLAVQAVTIGGFAVALLAAPGAFYDDLPASVGLGRRPSALPIDRRRALRVRPLYDDPGVVSDENLALVLRKVRPTFSRRRLKPNHVEHALRTWGVDAVFRDRRALSGREMLGFLIDHARYLQSWNGEADPLLVPQAEGVAVRWGREPGASVHHDHLLASLSEAGVRRDEPVFPPDGRAKTFDDLLQQSIRDFRLDEREVEWSAMAFVLWLPPSTTSWTTSDGRRVDFDAIARRLMRGDARYGTCSGTHRVYSLMLLYRVDADSPVLSPATRGSVRRHLARMRDLIVASQFPDGHWASNWSLGKASREELIDEPNYKSVIATGHHLEWLAIAPPEFHPNRAVVRKAARWLVDNIRSKSEREILDWYTFYSHVGSALALWRKTRPAAFWAKWRDRDPQ
ncbi:MAG: hypothetical protein ACE5KM_02030 [Planctomycetaceae bacterium]